MPLQGGASVHDLLRYDELYGVLICRDCQYAIQKSAIDSHLLRHKIYRAERRTILAKVAQLDIFEPENVQSPLITSAPIDGLPVLAGLQCAASGCRLLCVSIKRMRRHWNEAHPQQGGDDPRQRLASEVQLQTFFRGTKLRYFVVDAAATVPSHHAAQPPTAAVHSSSPLISDIPQPVSLSIDLNVLKYFQHFSTTTSTALPVVGATTSQHWRAVAIGLALENTNLMAGILAVSAAHAFVLASDHHAEGLHEAAFHNFSQQFSSEFSNSRNEHASSDLATTLSRQLHSIITMIQWSTVFPHNSDGSTQPALSVQSFIKTFRGCLNTPPRSVQEKLLSSAAIMDRSSLTGKDGQRASMARLHCLPFRMTKVFGRPNHPLDVVTIIAAVDMLLECFSTAYATSDPHMMWLAAGFWLERMPDHFHGLLDRRSPPALVVCAHAVPLFKHTERSWWFSSGTSERLLQCVCDQLPADEAKVMELVQGVMEAKGTTGSKEVQLDTNDYSGSFLC